MKFNLSNDQPGRLCAVFIVAPILFYKGLQYNDFFIILFSIVLFLWDLFWICTSEPNTIKLLDIECPGINPIE